MINFVEVDAAAIQDELIKNFEAVLGETLYPGDERRIFLLQFVPIIVSYANQINDTANQNLLQYARSEVLDALVDPVQRLPARKANCTIQFNISNGHPQITIPAGKRVSPDSKIYFATKSDIVVAVGVNTVSVEAESLEAGSKYNNFTPGQINILIDPTPYVVSISNTTVSSGGADIESDDELRERARLFPTSFSTAGPEDAYIYYAKSASQNIQDVSVTSPDPGEVKITVLADNGIPDQTTIDAVLAACNDKKVRPLTDNVTVSAPTPVNYSIDLSYKISTERLTDEATIREAIEGAGGAVDKYIAWQKSALGRSINPDILRKYLLDAGAFSISLTSPAAAVVNSLQVANLSGSPNIEYTGLE